MARRSFGGVVERTDRNGGHPGLDRDVAAEVLVRAVETQRPEVGRHEVGAVRWKHLEADRDREAQAAEGLPASKVTVVYSGVHLPDRVSDITTLRDELGLDAGALLIVATDGSPSLTGEYRLA